MSKKAPKKLAALDKKVLGMIDTRATMDDNLILQKQRNTTMSTFFGTDQMSAVAYFVSDLVAKGFNDKQIVDVVNNKYNLNWSLAAVRVCKSLLRKVWRAETACMMEDQISQELASIQTQEKEAWEAWEFSKRGIKKRSTKTAKSKGDAPELTYDLTEIIDNESVTEGNIKFLELINELHKERRKLLGLYAPEKKSAGAGNGGTTAIQFNFVGNEGNDGVGNKLAEVLGGKMASFAMPEQPVQEAQVVESKPAQADPDEEMQKQIEKFYNELIG